jgi:hypothetical protein
MASIKNYMAEITLSVAAFAWLWFVLTNVNPSLGNVYLWAAGISLLLLMINILIFDKGVRVTFQKKKGGHLEAFIAGAIGWVILLVSSFVILRLVEPAKANFGAIVNSVNAANPAFSGSKLINWITVSFAIGYTETQLFARGLEFVADRLKIPISRRTKYLFAFIITIVFFAIAFAIYHITAKGVESLSSLVIVGVMMAISLFMVAHFEGETRQAVWLHIIANGVAGFLVLLSGGLLFM